MPRQRKSTLLTSLYVFLSFTQIEDFTQTFSRDFKIDEKFNDSYFAKAAAKKSISAEAEFFAEGVPKEKEAYPESKASDQKSVDSAIVAAIKKTELLEKYIKASFGLSKGQFPHQLRF